MSSFILVWARGGGVRTLFDGTFWAFVWQVLEKLFKSMENFELPWADTIKFCNVIRKFEVNLYARPLLVLATPKMTK